MTCVLGSDEIRFSERLMGPRTQIAQVTDRCRDNLQTSGRFDQPILLIMTGIRLLAGSMLPL
jgi:hypothetical protein